MESETARKLEADASLYHRYGAADFGLAAVESMVQIYLFRQTHLSGTPSGDRLPNSEIRQGRFRCPHPLLDQSGGLSIPGADFPRIARSRIWAAKLRCPDHFFFEVRRREGRDRLFSNCLRSASADSRGSEANEGSLVNRRLLYSPEREYIRLP